MSTHTKLSSAGSNAQKLPALLSSTLPADWEALGKFFARVRQNRRKFRARCEQLELQIKSREFVHKRCEWKRSGRWVCRHGVFFVSTHRQACQCMSKDSSDPAAWVRARFMPALDLEVQCLVAVPFDLDSFQRLGELQAQLRRLGWEDHSVS